MSTRASHSPGVTAARAAGPVLLIAIVSASPAIAEDSEWPSLFGWTVHGARLGVGLGPDYLGSDDYRAYPSGAIAISRRGAAPVPYGPPDDGLSLGLLGTGAWTVGLVGRWRSSRDSDNDLAGFDDIDGTVEAGAFANWWPADWFRLRAEARRGFGGHESWVGDLSADAVLRPNRWVLTAGPRLGWGDSSFTRTYFTVDSNEAVRSPFAIQPFAADDTSWFPGALASAEYRVTRNWSLQVVGGYRRITGDAADSPIVSKLGSRDQFSASLSVHYELGGDDP